ncbi:MAG: hypothetical protein DHS20C01_09030 [marine bacterium B5-7]|nr:MAG: hypothetical protein DHS20C01_09030 [marine bacterium B5-7]
MNDYSEQPVLIETTSLKSYFHDSISTILDKNESDVGDDTRAYLINLLQHFSRSDRFFEWFEQRTTLRPLALLYGEAVQARNVSERRAMLRRLGDVALFVAGIFRPSLERKVVGVDYYINMGGGAYDSLSDSLAHTGKSSLNWQTFKELAGNFETIVDVLDEFAESSGLRGYPTSTVGTILRDNNIELKENLKEADNFSDGCLAKPATRH